MAPEEYVERAKELSADDDLASQVIWRSNQAKIMARRGQADEEMALAKEAAEIADSTEGLMWQGDAYQELATVIRQLNRPDAEKAAMGKRSPATNRKAFL